MNSCNALETVHVLITMIISPPGNDSFWENLRSTADVFFIFFSFQS